MADYGVFLVNISFWEPPVPQLLVMDTGSSTTWIKCRPCSSYNECPFFKIYADQTISSGNLATEQLTFGTSDEGIATISNFIFGCAHDFKENHDYSYNGIVGLIGDGATFSLVKQLGSKFSYCLGSVNDPYYNYNRLILGNGSIFEGSSTPLYVDGDRFLSLEGANLAVPPDNMFLQNRRDNTFCLAVQSSESISLGNQSIIGALAQQHYNFGYDLTTNRLYFEKIDCQLLTE
ncbi:hypothetical protein LguiA_008218 [Lonicera macranthoides]